MLTSIQLYQSQGHVTKVMAKIKVKDDIATEGWNKSQRQNTLLFCMLFVYLLMW